MTEPTAIQPMAEQVAASEAGAWRARCRGPWPRWRRTTSARAWTRARRPRSRALAEDTEHVMDTPPDQITWNTLARLAEHDPETAQAALQRIHTEAHNELLSGHRAARAIDPDGSPGPARFLQVREAFSVDWQPPGGIEASLIETLAIAHMAQLHWMERLTRLSTTEPLREDREVEQRGGWNPPTVDAAAAIDQAAAMVDRFNRLFARTLRALRDLRRYTPQVVVQNVGQLNVGAQQVNVTRAGRSPRASDARRAPGEVPRDGAGVEADAPTVVTGAGP